MTIQHRNIWNGLTNTLHMKMKKKSWNCYLILELRIYENITTFVNLFCYWQMRKVRKDIHGVFGDYSSAVLGLVLVTENQINFSMKAPLTRKPAVKKSQILNVFNVKVIGNKKILYEKDLLVNRRDQKY